MEDRGDVSVRPARTDELTQIAVFVAELQTQPAHRIAYFDETPAEIASYLEEWDPPWAGFSLVAERGGAMAGFVGAWLDRELGRAWLHGPLVAAEDWEAVAERLLEGMIAEVATEAISDLEVSVDVANERVATLAVRRGFEPGTVNHALEIGRAEIEGLPPNDVPPLPASHADAVTHLHDAIFPGAYYSGRQLVEQAATGKAIVLGLVEGAELQGYAAGRINAGPEGYLDFVGVKEAARNAGRGRGLVIAMCRALLDDPAVMKVGLSVRDDNFAARVVFTRLGFERTASLVGYRRRSSSSVEPKT